MGEGIKETLRRRRGKGNLQMYHHLGHKVKLLKLAKQK
jgi:hypothetical protein